jgi:ribose transport system permease protein
VARVSPANTPAAATAAEVGRSGGGVWPKPSQEQIVLLITVIVAVVFGLTLPGFASVGNLLSLLRNVAILGTLALGMGVVVIGRGIDLSQVAILAASSATAIQLMNAGAPTSVAIVAALALAIAIGVVNGAIIAFVEVPALFTTLATALVAFGLTRYAINTMIVYPPVTATGFLFLGQGRLFGIPMPVIVFVMVALVVHLLLSRTSIGRFVYAHGDNAEAARLSGIAVRPLTIIEYTLSAMIAFVAGLLMASSTASMNMLVVNGTLIFDVILVVVLGGISLVGGRGSVLSVVVGTALIGTLLNGLTIMDLDTNLQDMIKGFVLLGAIILDNRLHPRDEETARQGD